ncbi:methionine ABC transporter permease [Dysosmobacter sp.]|jgi:D-methionine transport system permease protein|uniref:methionine ABC transporter permease n=1 Tax=Dysosmobacter sp. TaxID=2591382 RepID=UPI002D806540|nr:methionine ABC transporter permease [uncultured Oscillibacter sp.]
MLTAEFWLMFAQGLWETLYVMVISTVIAYIIGLPLGLILSVTDADGLHPSAGINKVLGTIVNLLRSVPFLIMVFLLTAFTRLIVGTSVGSPAMIPPLVIAAFPFVARLVEASVREVDLGVIEAAQSMGASTLQIVTRVILPEATPSLIAGATTATVTILGYSAMAGIVGGGGLGAIAINYGYYRKESAIMWVAVVLIVILVQILQGAGNRIAIRSDKRIR